MINNLIGKRFGRLIVIGDFGFRNKHGHVEWICRCDCGDLTKSINSNLVRGDKKSCGCLNKELVAKRSYKHGDNCRGKTERLYRIWINMKKRCYQNSHTNAHKYKEKGIIVCSKWKDNYNSFKFWAIVNGYQDNLTIDRIDNDGNYEPSNCQWLTRSENTRKYFKENYHDSSGA